MAEASGDWYKSSGWRSENPSSPMWSESWESADPRSLTASEPQLPSTLAAADGLHTCPVDPDGQLAQNSPDPRGAIASLDSEEDSEQGEVSAGEGQSTSLSVQVCRTVRSSSPHILHHPCPLSHAYNTASSAHLCCPASHPDHFPLERDLPAFSLVFIIKKSKNGYYEASMLQVMTLCL